MTSFMTPAVVLSGEVCLFFRHAKNDSGDVSRSLLWSSVHVSTIITKIAVKFTQTLAVKSHLTPMGRALRAQWPPELITSVLVNVWTHTRSTAVRFRSIPEAALGFSLPRLRAFLFLTDRKSETQTAFRIWLVFKITHPVLFVVKRAKRQTV